MGWQEEADEAFETGGLQARLGVLRAARREHGDDPYVLLELGTTVKLLGYLVPAFELLQFAVDRLPTDDPAARLRAQFVLGLTWGDAAEPAQAVSAFEAAAAEHPTSRPALAARHYAEAYREVHGIA